MAADLRQLTVVLVRTRNPLNIGAVARAMPCSARPTSRIVSDGLNGMSSPITLEAMPDASITPVRP